MFTQIEQLVLSLADKMPLFLFSPLVSFLEEIIPPIPSPSIMILTGTMASVQGYGTIGLLLLALVGAIGKSLGAAVVYFLIDKVEDYFSGGIKKFTGVSHEQIEAFGGRFSKSWKDYFILTLLRAFPFVPSTLISVGSGLLKIHFKIFFISTLIGSFVRDVMYIYLGFEGISYAKTILSLSENLKTGVVVLFGIFLIAVVVYFWLKKRMSKIS